MAAASPSPALPAVAAPAARWRRGLADPAVGIWLAALGVTLLGWAVVAVRGGEFLTQPNITGILQNCVALGLIALGQTMVILTGSLDLSVAYLASLGTLVAAETMAGSDGNMVPAVVAVLALCAGVGLANGLIVTRLKVNAFIATLGVALILRGWIEDNYTGPAGDVSRSFQRLGYDRIGPVPVSVFLLVGVALALWFVLRRTRLGHHMYATGGDEHAARLSGVRTERTVLVAHVLCALCVGIAALFLAARFGAGSPWAGTEARYDLESIAAVVLGGTLLAGGRGGVVGTLGGVTVLAVLDSVFNQLAVDPFFKNVLRGVVIIAAVAVYARGRRSAGRSR
ncbi:ribose transport system permease protein [Streptomyces zhaozhouensis]|uniref:Ribose transport system permease protein n=1 Tax=Streptomyces zhaozhouensis TaxID=1300267 RepID=A0A286DSJ7_9ACTN|nr:ABC transporter permease [Streptomyces zhaozhouensis]SOD61652.1 ribose transport system permease protein [Streptomyces zhaozhouensis]